jgi:hypothetical protein
MGAYTQTAEFFMNPESVPVEDPYRALSGSDSSKIQIVEGCARGQAEETAANARRNYT